MREWRAHGGLLAAACIALVARAEAADESGPGGESSLRPGGVQLVDGAEGSAHAPVGSDAASRAPSAVRAAVALGHEGASLFREREFTAAFDKFAAAEKLAHSPVFVLYMARCSREQDQWLRAQELYQTLSNEELPPGAPDPWRAAVTEGVSELEALRRNFPRLNVSALPNTTPIEQITIDGRPVMPPFQNIRLDPGVHEVIVSMAGSDRRQRVDLGPGEQRELVFELSVVAAPVGAGTEPAVARAEALGAEGSASLRSWAWACFGVAATGVAIGATAGVLAILGSRGLDRPCDDGGPCSKAEFERDKAAAQRWATTATVATVLGGIGAGAGLSLLLLEPPRAESEPLRVTLTPNQLLLSGAF